MRIFENVESFTAAVGEDLGHSNWLDVDQQRINTFADATGDQQWIHVDPARAAAGPFGSTIAHGYLTLSLLPVLLKQIYLVENVAMAVNYGTNRVRFPSPVPVGSRIRATARLLSATPIAIGQQFTIQATIECEGSDKPACVVEAAIVMAGAK